MRLKPLSYRYLSSIISIFVFLLVLSTLFSSLFFVPIDYKGGRISTNGYTVMNNIVWSPEVRLTWLGNSSHPDILKSEDGNYNIVWQDFRNGNWDIYYLKVRSDGFKLVNDSRITYYAGNDTNPSLAVQGNYIYVVWQRYVNSHWAIYFSRILYSNANITIEIAPKPIREVNRNCTNPKVVIDSEGFLHVVWQEYNGTNWEIMYDKIDSSGRAVFAPIDISNDDTNSTNPQIVVDEYNHIHVFWIDDKIAPGYSVFYRELDCCGYFLSPIRRISVVSPETTIDSYYYNGSLYTVFSCSREKLAYEVIFTRLNSTGYTMVDDTNLTPSDRVDSINPHLAVIHNRMFVVWDDYPEGIVRFSIYDENGTPVGEILNLSSNNSFRPSISVNTHTLGIVWERNVENGTYLYFRSGEFPNVSIKTLTLKSEGNNSNNVTITADIFSSAGLYVDYNIYLDEKLVISSTLYLNGEGELQRVLRTSPGWHRIRVILDPYNKIIENNESDDEMESQIFIKYFSYQLYSAPIYEVPAGRERNITLYVENTGNWQDNYSITVSYNKSAFKITPSVLTLHLNESEIKGINLTVFTSPNVIVGNYTINITVKSLTLGLEESRNITLKVLPFVDFKIEYIPLFYVLPGQKVDISLLIRNLGNCNDTYEIHITQNQNWPMVYKNATINATYGSIAYFNLTLLIPNGTYAYTKNFVNFTVRSMTLNISMNGSVLIIVRPVHNLEGYVTNMLKNGTHYRISFNLINTGNMKDLINLEVAGDVREYAYISNASLILAPGENSTVWVNVYLPPLIPAGSYSLVLNAYYQNTSLLSIPVSLTVEEIHRYAVMIEKLSEGNLVAFRIEIKNTGNAPEIIDVLPVLTKKYNTTWILYYNGDNYTNTTTVYINPNQTAVVIVTLNTTLPNGMYSVNILFSSASHINKNVTLEFRVGQEEKSIWQNIADFFMANLIYIVIIAVVIGAVIVYLIKFRG